MKTYVVTRDVTPEEAHWLSETVTAGTIVYRCTKETYNCIGWGGFPATLDNEGGYPFFELPLSAVEERV